MLRKTLAFTLGLAISVCQAGEVRYLDKSQPAPYNGYLFDLEAEKANRLELLDLDFYKALNVQNKSVIELHKTQTALVEEQAKLWRKQSDNLATQLVEARDNQFWRSALYFLAGAALTTGLAFAVSKSTK
jgi:hypothetical protein